MENMNIAKLENIIIDLKKENEKLKSIITYMYDEFNKLYNTTNSTEDWPYSLLK